MFSYIHLTVNDGIYLFLFSSDRPELVELLLDHGAHINFNDTNFGMPIHVATMKNNIRCAEVLLKRGQKSVTIPEEHGFSVLMLCCMNSMKTCPSITFYFMKNSFSDISRKCTLPNMIRAGTALIIFGKIHFLLTSENEFFMK